MKLQYRLSSKGKKISDTMMLHEVMARFHSGTIDQYAKTGVFVPESYTDKNGNKKTTWKDGNIVIPRISFADKEQVELKKMLDDAKNKLYGIECSVDKAYARLTMNKRTPPKKWLQNVIDGKDAHPTQSDTMLGLLDTFIANHPTMKPSREKRYKSMRNTLARYEASKGVVLDINTLSHDDLQAIKDYIVNGDGRTNSENYAVMLMKRLRAFVRWYNGMGKEWIIEPLTTNNPFDRFAIGAEQYGTPYYLTIKERNKLEAAELPARLARQRDIFVFHCLIGCRVSDLWAMTKDNVIDGAIEYIPRKTKEGRPITVRVPLNSHAKAILDRYKDNGDNRLFPFVAQQQYNEDIKDMIKLAGIKRMVTVLNPVTRQEEKKHIYEVASSHMARRTFIGNLYKQVKDPNLVGKLSGHTENSRAFARYRDIDEDMAKELVSMLE